MKKLFTGLFRSSRKRLSLTHDNEMGAFREKINQLVEQKDSLSDDDISKKVDELKVLTQDLPDAEGKAKLDRFLDDFKAVKEQDANVAKDAGSRVADLFEELDKNAMQDTPEAAAGDAAPEEPPAEEPAKEGEAAEGEPEQTDGAEEAAEAEVEETEAPAEEEVVEEKKEVSDDDGKQYSLEEIYQFIKKRMAEEAGDAAPEEPAEEKTDETVEEEATGDLDQDASCDTTEETTEEKDDEVTTDHAPFIPLTLNNAPRGGLAAMFAKVKGEN